MLAQNLVFLLLLTTTTPSPSSAQWLSFKSSRNPKSSLWFPNMPASKSLQQRSSVGNIRGLPSSSSSSSSNSQSNSNHQLNNQETRQMRQGSRPIGHRSAPSYQTVHGGTISRQESVNLHPRNSFDPNRNRFMHRSGQPQQHQQQSQWQQSKPTVVTAKHLSINLNQNQQPPRNKMNWNVGPASNAQNNGPQGYASSRRLLEVGGNVGVGRSGHPDTNPVTRRPITQIAGALQDSWPNTNAHHHLSPVLKNQKQPQQGRNYYDNTPSESAVGGWGSQVRVSDHAIEIKNTYTKPKVSFTSTENKPVDRQLALSSGREKLVSNTLNTLAKLSPKKPIFVYLRIEGIAAINQGAEAGDVIKKLAGGSKLPFYNGTKSLPKENVPQVFLAPEDMPPPTNYGKIPIPNLKARESSQKPTFTKILLPGGTRMTSQLSRTTTTTTTTPSPSISPSRWPFVHSTAQSIMHPQLLGFNATGPQSQMSGEALSLDQKIKILQMFQSQAEAAMHQQQQQQQHHQHQQHQQQQHHQQQNYYQQVPTFATPSSPSPSPSARPSQPSHNEILRGVLPHGAILESITTMDGNNAGSPQSHGLNPFPTHVPEQGHNNIYNPDPTMTGPPVGDRSIKDILGSIIETAVSKTVSDMLPTLPAPQQPQQPPGRVGHIHPQQHPQQQAHQHPHPQQQYHQQFQHQQHPMPPPTQQYFPHQQQQQQPQFQPGQSVIQYINGQPMHVVHSPAPWMMQSKMDSGPTQFINGPTQQPPSPSGPPPPPQRPTQRPSPLKNALAMLGIQSTPRPEPNRTPGPPPPGFMSTPRPLFQNRGPTGPTRMPHGPPQGSPFPPQQQDGNRPPQTLIVQTPDHSKPNQKSTFVISGGSGPDLPDLQKIMNVLNDLNGPQGQQNQQGVTAGPTRAPLFAASPSPSGPTPYPPTRRPTMVPFNQGRPQQPQQQQPQVMIRHPSGTPTQGPFIMSSTGKPPQFVSSTFAPSGPTQGPTTPRPIFMSSTGVPIFVGPSPSSSPIQVIKAISHPEMHQPNTIMQQSPSPSPSQQPHQQQQHQQTFQTYAPQPSPTPTQKIITIHQNTNRPSPSPSTTAQQQVQTFLDPTGETPAKIIEVDPGLSPEEIQKSIMDSIMKHQQEKHGGISNGPIVINAHPSMASALGNSPHFMSVKPTGASVSPTASTASSSAGVDPTKDSYTVTPAIDESSSSNKEGKHQFSSFGSAEKSHKKPSKIHHHSKEVSDEKPYKKPYKGSTEKNKDQSSEEKVIEKVITEEKIVWNKGSREGEMIPSRIKTEERIILRPHGGIKSNEVKKPDSVEKLKSAESEDNKSDQSSAGDASNFAGLLRSKLKFEKMKQHLYPKKQIVDPEVTNPFSRYLHPSSPSAPPTTAATSPLTQTTFESSPSPSPIMSSTISPLSDNGRFKIRPGDISKTEMGPIYGISPSGQPIMISPTAPTGYMESPSPSPSAFPPSAYSPTAPSSYIGPSPSSFQPYQQSPYPTMASELRTMAPGSKDEKLLFIPADSLGAESNPSPTVVPAPIPSPTFQTKNGQNQTVVFTTMNQLPDLMSQLSGSGMKTEVRMIDDMDKFQQTLAKVQATQASSTLSPPSMADRRADGVGEDKPFTWRPNGTDPSPTLESLRQRFPAGVGASMLHAVSAGFSANDKPKWTQPQQPQQIIYTMANGVPVALNGYQPFLIQGTKEPMMAYYGYNWNQQQASPQLESVSSTLNPSEITPEPKYTSRFRGSAPTPDDKEGPVYKSGMTKEPISPTRDPLDPLSEELEANENAKKNKASKKGSGDNEKGSRRRRPGVLKEEEDAESEEESSEEEVAQKKNKNRPQSVTPNVLSRRIDESDEDQNKVKVQKEMFVNSGEKSQDEAKPTAKLPILLAPSIISRKSVVSKTGPSYSSPRPGPPTAEAIAAETPKSTHKLTSAVSKLLSTMAPTKEFTGDKEGDDELRETQAELKSLLKKLQQKLSRDDVYELGDGYYDYYDELAVPSTKATKTTTTKGTKKPSKKNKKSSKKSSKKSKSKSKSSKKNKKDKKTTKKPKLPKTTTTTRMTTPTSQKPAVIVTSSTLLTNPPTTASTTISTTPILKHNRHPVSSIEAFTSPPTTPTTTTQQVSLESASIEPQQYLQTPPQQSVEVPTNPPADMSFVYPQVSNSNRDSVASKTHFRKRPLWVRRKGVAGSTESLEPVGQPVGNSNSKVIRLVRRKRPGMRRRPVFVQQSLEVDQESTPASSTTAATYWTSPSTTPVPVDVLFDNTNELGKRIGTPDSMEGAAAGSQKKGKRKLKLIRLKGQRAQWRLKMNDDEPTQQQQQQSFSTDELPQAAQLVGSAALELPQAEPLSSGVNVVNVDGVVLPPAEIMLQSPQSINAEIVQPQVFERQSRQESSASASIEAKVCIRGKCEIISKN